MTATGGTQRQVVLTLSGDIDAMTQAGYRHRAEQMLAEGAVERFVVDMTDVATIDSSGLGLLVHLQSLTRDKRIEMVLANVPPRAGALLKRTGLDRVFEIAG
ncbi:MAG TPA: STAS domain-containing protein [Jatrophihabitans sp.]|jgi:anti-anti-sigma factor